MNKQKWMQTLMQEKKPLPVLSFPAAAMLGIPVSEMCRCAEQQARAICAIAERYDMPAAVTPMELSVEAEAFGAAVRFSDAEAPSIVGRAICDAEQAAALAVPPVGAGRTGVFLEAVRLFKERRPDRPLLAGMIGPFSLVGRLYDLTEAMIGCYTEPEVITDLCKRTTAFLIAYASALREAGADGIIMAEPSAGLLSPELNETFSVPYCKEIFDAVHGDDFITVYHNCGNTVKLLDGILATGADAYHFGNAVDLGDILPRMPKSTPTLGNLDPVSQFLHGTPQSVADAATELCQRFSQYEQFVPSSGCDIPPATPVENIDAFFRAVKEATHA